jgi:2,3-diketo-5-methylthiopentyl-1-phosphate enolase
LKYSAHLAIEQTTGTLLMAPERCVGRVVGVYEAPAYQIEIPKDVDERHFILHIAYPWENFGAHFSTMLSTVAGNISSSGKVKLLDLEFPKAFLKQFKGPKFGIEGIRGILGVYNRPLLNNVIKPSTGLDPEATAKMAYKAALAGVDIIKDDEKISDPPYCPLIDRVRAVMSAIKRADEEKGEKTLYAFNVTSRTDRLRDNAYRAIEAGARCLMVNYFTIGLDAAWMLAEDKNITVPILAHSDFTGAVYESPWSGISTPLIGGKLPRLAGLDMIVTLSPYGSFPMLLGTFYNTGIQMRAPMHDIKPVFQMPGGGTTQGHVEDIIKKFGNDVVIVAGGAIHSHPMGPESGAKAFRQAIDSVVAGQSLADAGKQYKELGMALDLWGIYSDKDSSIFDL